MSAAGLSAQTFDNASYDSLLQMHVLKGRVDYSSMKADSSLLNEYLSSLAAVDPVVAVVSVRQPGLQDDQVFRHSRGPCRDLEELGDGRHRHVCCRCRALCSLRSHDSRILTGWRAYLSVTIHLQKQSRDNSCVVCARWDNHHHHINRFFSGICGLNLGKPASQFPPDPFLDLLSPQG